MHHDFRKVNEWVYVPCGWKITDSKQHEESKVYGACSYVLHGIKVEQRIAKITPTKVGQFVTLWKRNERGITEPLTVHDDFDVVIIIARKERQIGQFIFPKSVLAEQGIITRDGKERKRGFRVYPPWDVAPNKQAAQSQGCQGAFF